MVITHIIHKIRCGLDFRNFRGNNSTLNVSSVNEITWKLLLTPVRKQKHKDLTVWFKTDVFECRFRLGEDIFFFKFKSEHIWYRMKGWSNFGYFNLVDWVIQLTHSKSFLSRLLCQHCIHCRKVARPVYTSTDQLLQHSLTQRLMLRTERDPSVQQVINRLWQAVTMAPFPMTCVLMAKSLQEVWPIS